MGEWDVRLLTASYSKGDNDGIIVELFGKTRDGRSITLRKTGFRPYFHVAAPPEDVLPYVQGKDDFLTIEPVDLFLINKGRVQNCSKVVIKFPWAVPQYRSELKRQGMEVFAADIPFHHRFIYDNDLPACFTARGEEVKGDYTTDLVVNLRGFTEIPPFTPKLKILSFDIENSITDETIYTICYVIKDEGGIRAGEPVIGTEKEMIERFSEVIQMEDPDVITGYNIDGYDIPFIMERAKKYGIDELKWGRDHSTPRRVMNKFWRCTGRLIADAWWAVKIEIKPKQETLNAVSKSLLGEEKLDVDMKMKVGEDYDPRAIDKEWLNNRDKVLAYCTRDAELALKILGKVGRIRKGMDLAAVSRMPVDDVLNSGSSQLIDAIMIRAADRHAPQVAVPLTGNYDDDEENAIEGGYVHEISPGVYHWVCVLDFKSMYPSLIISRNICFTTRDDRGTIVSPLGVHFLSKEQQPGILPSILADLMRRRDETKALAKRAKDPEEAHYYDGLQGAIKILMNSFYGVFASSFYRFTDRSIGGSITAFARETTKGIIKSLTDEGVNVIYSDTDSIFVQSPHDDLEGSLEFGKELAARFSKEGGSLEFEKIMEPLFSHGKKKRYVGRMVWPKEELVIRGYEVRRTDSFDLQSESLMTVFEFIMDGNTDEAVKAARGYVQDTLAGKVPLEKLVISKGCRKFSEYANPDAQATVQTAKKLMEMGYEFVPGMKVSWIVTNFRKKPQEVQPYISGQEFTYTPDYRYYAERLAQTLSRATEVFGWGEKDLLNGNQQASLFDYAPEQDRPKIKLEQVKKTDKKLSLDDFM
ncbi:MAG TPA: DNA polymerase domain-containing protein [Methanomassiliicoccales archaeon]|nr:DNA polymerase domain-containing protein [Methanomassiliicoccales archaeon]